MIGDDVLIIDWSRAPKQEFVTPWESQRRRFEIAQNVTSLVVDYTVNGCAQLTVELVDIGLRMYQNNYFQIGTPVLFKGGYNPSNPDGFGMDFRISTIEISQSDGEYWTVKLELRDKAVQEMKEDKTPQSFRSATGFEYARKVAVKFGLEPYIEEIPGIKQSTIKVKEKNNRDSVWDVLLRSAQDISFMCFVANKRLFYGSPQWMLGRWGFESVEGVSVETYQGKTEKRQLYYVPLLYPHEAFRDIDPESKRLLLLKAPSFRRSEDSPKESEGSAEIWGGPLYLKGEGSAYRLRAGMTVMPRIIIDGKNVIQGDKVIEGFDNAYIITNVKYQFAQPEPMAISFATVDKLAPEDKRKINEKINEITVISGSGGS